SNLTEKACPEPEDLEEDTLKIVVDGKTLREIIPTLPFTFQFNRNPKQEDWKDIDQVLQLHQLLKDLFQWSMGNIRFNLASSWEEHGAVKNPGGEGKQDKAESSHYPSYRRTADPDRAYSDSFRLTRRWPNQLSSGFIPFRNQHISGQESPFFTFPGSFQEKTRIKGQKQDNLQPKEERVKPNDPEAVGFGERSEQEPEVVLHTSRISSPISRNITPTQIEHNVVTPESNLKSDALWLPISQYAEQTQKEFAELEPGHERMKKLSASMEKIVKALQEGHAQLNKASKENNKRLNLVFEEKNHSKRDRDWLDQDTNILFNCHHSPRSVPKDFDLNSESELIHGNISRAEPFSGGRNRNISMAVQNLVQSSQRRRLGNIPKPLAGGHELLLTHQELSGSGEDHRTLRRLEPIVLQRQDERVGNDSSIGDRGPSGIYQLQTSSRSVQGKAQRISEEYRSQEPSRQGKRQSQLAHTLPPRVQDP
ncbi:hypothetical protein O181_122216, partial [Austropuccinia psidii MF-1]|nr:hypothetical protein [Austropuccinia psidii MF-1]